MRARNSLSRAAEQARKSLSKAAERARGWLAKTLPVVARTARTALVDVVAIAREMLAWPTRLWLGTAEVAGEVVLTAWRGAVLPLLELSRSALRASLRIAEREVTPARGLTVVALAATIALGASQFSDYRAVKVGVPQYSSAEDVAAAPEVEQRTPRSAHGIAVFAIAIAALFVTAFAATGRWRLARLLIFLGAAVIVISLAVDAPTGLREGRAGIAYEGAEATLLHGFWAQLWSAVTLMLAGPLLATYLRGERDARWVRPRRGLRSVGVPASGFGGSTDGSSIEGAAS